MATAVSAAEVTSYGVVGPSGNLSDHFDYFVGGPQVFRADHIAGALIKPHFHKVQQFQVIVRGGGMLGRQLVKAGAFHYADAFTPYGPIAAGDEGLSFFTIRMTPDAGAHQMPGSRATMERRAGRAEVCQLEPPEYVEHVTQRRTLIGPHSDGLTAIELLLGPNTEMHGPPVQNTQGQIYVVLDGIVEHEGETLPDRSLLWAGAQEDSPHLRTREAGAQILVLQFPRDAESSGRRGALR